MADKRISQLIERVDIANNDVLPIVASGATTTNKVTVSTLQDWMQDNLDVGVTSVGLTMPSAFQVSGSPITTSGNITVTATGTASQYIRGDGTLADFPTGGGGGGASVSYYLNGSVSQGTIGGVAYLEMNKTPILGAGTDFNISADGYIASFITDAGDPALLEIPAGNWNFETYFQASSGGGTPSFYVELYKVSGSTATLIASNSANPELIAFGTNTTPYFSALAVPQTTLALTDRLAIRIYVVASGRTITLHTENSNLCQVITTFTTGLTALNGLTAQVQNFATGTSGTDFNISSSGSIHTFNLPDASASNRGAVTTGTQTFAGEKIFSNTITVNTPANGLSTIYNGRSLDSANIIRFNNSGASSLQNFIQSTPTDLVIGSHGNTPIFFVTNNGGVGGGLRLTISGNGSILAQGSFEANSIRRTGGTSSQFLKADGSVDSSTYVTTDTNQSITGFKSFANGFSLASAGGTNQPSTFKNIGTLHEGTASVNQIGFNSGNNIYFGKGLNNGGVISWNNAAVRYYTLPDADGTIALTSDLGNYVTLGTTQTITGSKTFNNRVLISNSGSLNTLDILHSSGSGIAVDISKAGNGEGLRVAKTSGTGNAVTISGGLLSAEAATLTGDLNGTSASFSGAVTSTANEGLIIAPSSGASYINYKIGATSYSLIGVAGTTSDFIVGSALGDLNIRATNNQKILFSTNNGSSSALTISSTGAATFSSSVTANGLQAKGSTLNNGNSVKFLRADNTEMGYIGWSNENTNNSTWLFKSSNGNPIAFSPDATNQQVIFNIDGSAFFNYPILGSRSFVFRTVSGRPLTLETIAPTGIHSLYLRANDSGRHLISSNYLSGGVYLPLALSGRENDSDFVLSTSGNVGIGTASPGTKLDVVGSDIELVRLASTATNGSYLSFRNSGTLNGAIGTGSNIISGLTNSDLGLWTTGLMAFLTGGTERMRITSGGFLKASNDSTYAGISSSYHEMRTNQNTRVVAFSNKSATLTEDNGILIQFAAASPNNTTARFIVAEDSTATRFVVYSNGNVQNQNNSYGSLSDIKLKENIEDATPKLNDLMKVKVRNYNFIGDDKKQIGVIAQELEEVFPAMIDETPDYEEVEVPQVDEEGNEVLNEEGEVVTTKERVSKGTTTKSVKYSVFVPMLIKAMQEQQEQIKSLTEQVEALKSQING